MIGIEVERGGRAANPQALLREVGLFSSLEERELDLVWGLTTTKRLKSREVLFRKGDPGNQLFAVLTGRLKVVAAGADGKEIVFEIVGPGDVLGEIAIMDSNPRSATVVAMEPCRLLTLHRRDFVPFLERHPTVAIRLGSLLAKRLRRLSEHTEDALFLTLPARLAKKLLSLSAEYGEPTRDGLRIDVRLPQQDLADLVGSTRETVNKQLRSWEAAGLVRLERTRVIIQQQEPLERIARFAPELPPG